MSISQSALDSAVAATAGAVGSATAQTVIDAALPYLLADYRERLVKASAELAAMADQKTDMGNSYFRLCGKQQGVDLALSYLDEMTR